MKTMILLILLGVSFTQAQNIKLEVNISGFDSNDGKVKIGLYNSDSSFLQTTFKNAIATIENKKATVTFTDLPKGDYAISLYHDENGNGVLDRNMFGIPSEDYAASNNAKGNMGPPKYTDAKFTVTTNSKINIILNN